MIHTLVQGSTSAMNQQLKDNNEAVTQQLEAITALGRKLKKTSASLDSHIDAEIQRLTKSLAESIEGSIKDSCDKELAKVGEATQVLHDYSDKVKQQHRKLHLKCKELNPMKLFYQAIPILVKNAVRWQTSQKTDLLI